LALPPFAIAASLPIGAFATSVLVVNNLRDIETDRIAGKRTLAVRFGRRAASLEYAGLLVFAYGMLPALWLAGASAATVVVPLFTLPVAVVLVRTVVTARDGAALNKALSRTAALEVGFALLFAVGLLL
jgi:1,4-dihydroxy-2-naphthoate octaprenyltransferase